jgi:hypothetical protein
MSFVLLFFFYGCLGSLVFLTFFASWFSYWVASAYVVPWATGLDFASPMAFWDAPLTPRGVVALGLAFGLPTMIFTKVGLLSIRDGHQVAKEQMDRIKRAATARLKAQQSSRAGGSHHSHSATHPHKSSGSKSKH